MSYYHLYEGCESLGLLRASWEALESRTECLIFQTYTFARLWCDDVAAATKAVPLVVTCEEAGVTVGLFAAAVVHKGPVRLLTWLGGPDLFDYCDILYDPSATVSADEFIEHAVSLLRARVPTAFLYLTNVRHDAVAYETLKATARPYKHSAAPYVPIQGSFEDYVSSLGRDQRRNVKRLLRRLESAGKTRFRLLRAGDPELVEVATRLVTLKKDRFARMGVRADLFSPEHTEYRLHQMRDDSHTAVVCLWLDATMIAAEMVFIYRDRMYLILASFDEAYARFAPGRLLDFHTLEVCHQGGLRVCDFCWGDERSKYQWTNLDMPMTTFVSNDVAGRLLIAAGATGRWTIDRIARLRRRGGVRPSPPAASDRRPPTVDPEALGTP